MLTKGKMIRELKLKGIRTGDKNGSKVQLEHLKAYQIIDMYYKNCTTQND